MGCREHIERENKRAAAGYPTLDYFLPTREKKLHNCNPFTLPYFLARACCRYNLLAEVAVSDTMQQPTTNTKFEVRVETQSGSNSTRVTTEPLSDD